jgi:hypothetical protein
MILSDGTENGPDIYSCAQRSSNPQILKESQEIDGGALSEAYS